MFSTANIPLMRLMCSSQFLNDLLSNGVKEMMTEFLRWKTSQPSVNSSGGSNGRGALPQWRVVCSLRTEGFDGRHVQAKIDG